MAEPQTQQTQPADSSGQGAGEDKAGWRSQVTKGVQSGLSGAKNLLSSAAPSERPEPESTDSHSQEQSWKHRIAGISAHLKAPFTHESAASSQGIAVSEEVEAALKQGRAVVALESTIISHGMPFPQNLKTALAVEDVVRENGAVPATVAVIGGRPHVGLPRELLDRIARGGQNVQKTSRRDLASVIARGGDGATTVSATMILAARAGISVFVTGGIGGVHRGGEVSWDVSSDLTEFSKTPVAVVCAGAKSILDIPRTLEFLETQECFIL